MAKIFRDEAIMIPYLRRLVRERRALEGLIDASRSLGMRDELATMKSAELRLADKISALRRHYYGRGLTGP